MNYYKATIQSDGPGYFGFQWQKDIPSIQNDFNQTLKKLMSGKITTMGASRTDTGVHAFEQIVKITSEQQIECKSFLRELNRTLPTQIRCISIESCVGTFKPTVNNSTKEYRYFFTNKLQSSCVDQRFIANNPYRLDIDLMKRCAREIVGKHDFRNFYSSGSNVKSTVREIIACEISEIDPLTVFASSDLFSLPLDLNSCYQLRIEGNGFLKQMVRHIMSALWLVGGGKISQYEFYSLINGGIKTRRLWKVASPRGLYLYRINYP